MARGTTGSKRGALTAALKILLTLAALAFALRLCWRAYQSYWYAAAIPDGIAVSRMTRVHEVFGFREGCGAAVFAVGQSTLDEINDHGLTFFSGATRGRRRQDYYRFNAWRETPWEGGPLRGLSCANFDEAFARQLYEAAGSAESFYAEGYEFDLLLVPELKVIILSYSG